MLDRFALSQHPVDQDGMTLGEHWNLGKRVDVYGALVVQGDQQVSKEDGRVVQMLGEGLMHYGVQLHAAPLHEHPYSQLCTV